MCVSTDGYMGEVEVGSIAELRAMMYSLFQSYNAQQHLHQMEQLAKYSLTEQQFAQLIGRCRMYNHLPNDRKAEIPQMLFGEQQMNTVVKDYYRDESFCKNQDGTINLWRLYNLFTGANKSSYIDSFLDRGVNAYHLVEQIRYGLENKNHSWYLN